MSRAPGEYYRADGVRITHDPYAPGMAEKYGVPGRTDAEGFDPYRDSVGPGIYGGRVQRDALGRVIIGRQYQNHNPRPGPVYAGGGYTPLAEALREHDPEKPQLRSLLTKYPELANDISTGGAQPLHLCGMSANNEDAVRVLVSFGADIEALDTYGMTPLHRMASNNLAGGARMLLHAGADPANVGQTGQRPEKIAQGSSARKVLQVLDEDWGRGKADNILGLQLVGAQVAATATGTILLAEKVAEVTAILGAYSPRAPAEVPSAFARVCLEQGLEAEATWSTFQSSKLPWFQHSENESYMYWSLEDKQWWVRGPGNVGAFTAAGPMHAPPAHGWREVSPSKEQVAVVPPVVLTFRGVDKREH